MDTPQEKTILSGVQPSGVLHLGNYLGAIKQWVELQENNTSYFCIVDQHAITIPYNPKELPDRVLDTAAMYVALGLDPNKSVIFIQSHVSAHAELAWLLGTQTPFGEMSRMTQFKDKSAKQRDNTTFGLFAYPVLMAADILLYQPDLVPVGEDQTQHLELTRDIAKRFNKTFGETFTLPKGYTPKDTARVMSLSDPKEKMSKSGAEKSYIGLTDDPDTIRKKIGGAATDTKPVFSFTKSGAGVKNLLHIYKALSGKTTKEIESEFEGLGYKEFKETLAETIITHLEPIQEKFQEIRADEADLRIQLARGAHQAQTAANQTLNTVRNKMGLL